jgi:hypothetical protein
MLGELASKRKPIDLKWALLCFTRLWISLLWHPKYLLFPLLSEAQIAAFGTEHKWQHYKHLVSAPFCYT